MIPIHKTVLAAGISALLAGCTVQGHHAQGHAIGALPSLGVLGAPIIAEAMPMERAVMESPVLIVPSMHATPQPRAGVVTAGDIDDTRNLGQFMQYQRQASAAVGLLKSALDRPVLAQLQGPSGQPASGARFTLWRPGARAPFYDGYASVDGMITVFPQALGQSRLRSVEMRVFAENGAGPLTTTLSTGGERQIVTLSTETAWSPDFLDLVFVVDTTGSMADELAWLALEIGQISRKAQAAAPGVDIRFGLVVYKAPADPYVVKSYGFTRNVDTFTQWVASERSSGGAGGPEVVADALQAAVALDWRRGRGERLIFQIGDEPPLASKAETYYRAAQKASANNIQIFGVAASGADPQLEFLMRQGAVMTGGRYLFLTDDSGVGLAHAEPTISCYQVTLLDQLMTRVLQSELSGRRVEANQSDVIREVGSYQNGQCLN